MLELVRRLQVVGPLLGGPGHLGVEGERGRAVLRAVGVQQVDCDGYGIGGDGLRGARNDEGKYRGDYREELAHNPFVHDWAKRSNTFGCLNWQTVIVSCLAVTKATTMCRFTRPICLNWVSMAPNGATV
ncbi:hypothetical protein Lesp02_58250 [Lentzea sp. NBRC 105346]|nr:hypothetical protein Lesp02_58250 [Lentzea sp. NBRC 105346]